VRCDSPRGASVAAHVVLAMAARAGLPPLMSGRIQADVAAAAGSCAGPVELACTVTEDGLYISLAAPADQLAGMAALLDGHRPQMSPGKLELRLQRTKLRVV
jgi:hypothetical protein